MTKISILLVDDHAIVREGYRTLLAKQTGMQVVAEAENSAQAYEMFKQFQPDVVITDISLPSDSGLNLISRIKKRCSQAKILVFSMHQNTSFATQAFQAGALGYVTKSSEPDVLLRAINDVYHGHSVLSADIAQALAMEKLGTKRIAFNDLTVREFEILTLLVKGQSHEKIATTLSISTKTVGNCHYLIKRKLGVTSDIDLIRLVFQFNLLDQLDFSSLKTNI